MDIDAALLRYKGYGKGFSIIERQIDLPEGNFINSVIGPRRAGKTFFMLQCKNSIDLPDSNKIFINAEDIDLEGITSHDLDKLEEAMFSVYSPDRSKAILLFIDEVQNLPSWGRWLRTLADERIYRIIISGSTSVLSTDKLPDELRGRAINTIVLPFSFSEYCSAKGVIYSDRMRPEEAGAVVSAFRDYLEYGGYPLVVEAKTPELKAFMLRELYETVLQRDIIEKHRIRKPNVLRAFINTAMGSACRVVSAPALSSWFTNQGTKLSDQAAANYLAYAQDVFLFFFLYQYSRKPKQRNVKPRLYLPDSGLLEMAGADTAKKLENHVFAELMRRGKRISYLASPEIDFVVESGRGIEELIQVSYSIEDPGAYAREAKALTEAAGALKCRRLKIITFNEEKKLKIGRYAIEVIPAWKWMLSLPAPRSLTQRPRS